MGLSRMLEGTHAADSFFSAFRCCRSVQLLPMLLNSSLLLPAPMVPHTAVQGWQLTARCSQAMVLPVRWRSAETQSPRQQAPCQANTIWGPLRRLRCRRAPAWPLLYCQTQRSQARA